MAQNPPTTHSLNENVAGLLCYVLGWVSGLIFFLLDKRPFVRFHAAQSMVVFGGLLILDVVIGIVFGAPFMVVAGVGAFGTGHLAYGLISLVAFVLWIVLMIKAYQGERFHVPIAGDIAENIARKQSSV